MTRWFLFLSMGLAAISSIADDFAVIKAIEDATGWTAEELANGLNMLNRAYEKDMETPSGRIRWHGPIVSNVTNETSKVQTHEDGWVYIQPFRPVVVPGVEQRLSAAERLARREREAEAKKQRRIAELKDNLPELAAELAQKKQYPIELAAMLLQTELNKLIGTNTVDTVITPQR